jgi:hypothetical protein
MAISEARLDEFIAIYERRYGRRLPAEEALPIATRLVAFFRLLMRPLPAGRGPAEQGASEPA